MKRMLIIGALALAGFVAAIGITTAAANLSSQSIGISEEPIDAGADLVVPNPAGDRERPGKAPPKSSPERTPDPYPAGAADPDDRGSDDSGSDDSGSDDSGGDDSGSDDSGSDDSGSDD